MASSLMACRFTKETLSRHLRYRATLFSRFKDQARYTTSVRDEKKLLIRNVFKDNPSAKYWLLGALAVAAGTTYYVYNNQNRNRLVVNILPPSLNHHCIGRDSEVETLKSLLQDGANTKNLKQIQITGPPGSGKTQLARLLAESINCSRRESLEFKLWPRDEVSSCLLACNKQSLLYCLKQLAVQLGCFQDEIKLNKSDLEHQLDVVSEAVKNKLKEKIQWLLIIDDHDTSKQLMKWLPNADWGSGYVIYTVQSRDAGNLERTTGIAKYNLNQMSVDSARQLFLSVVNEIPHARSFPDPPDHLLQLLHCNPLSIAYAAIYFRHQTARDDRYCYQELCSDLQNAVKLLSEENSRLDDLLSIQTTSVSLAARAMCEYSPELVHAFDLLGSCKVNHSVPMGLLSCHLKTPDYHVKLNSDVELNASEASLCSEDSAPVTVSADLDGDRSLYSVHGIVSRALKMSERIKLEVDALKSLFGYGAAVSGGQVKAASDGLQFIRSCPLLVKSCEQRADVEVITTHPIVHNVLRQLFINVTIPLLEQQHLLIAERKHLRKSYFSRLQRFDRQKAICEYRNSLGNKSSLQGRESVPLVRGSPHVSSIISGRSSGKNDENVALGNENVNGHLQEHFARVVNSFSNYYRVTGGDMNGAVARALLLPHLEALLHESWLTAGSKGQVYRTMARVYFDVLGDQTTSKRLLNEAYDVYKKRYDENSLEVAGLLAQQGELYCNTDELHQSKEYLERALSIYQKDRKTSQANKQPFEYGQTLVALGVIYNSLGENSRSKDLLEKGLMELQNAAPGDPQAKENMWFAAEISSAVTNLGHAYLSLGKINQGRKLLELALMGHQNVHGDAHAEVIRTLTTLSIAHAMQGNSHESKRLRSEAGRMQKKLDTKTRQVLV